MTILADIKRVMRGHSDRALIHAVDARGLEYKIEVPLEDAASLRDGSHQLVLSWSVHPIAAPAPSASSPPAPSPGAVPSATAPEPMPAAGSSPSADERFMALMRGRSQRTAAPDHSPDPRANERRLAELLGYKVPPQQP